MNKKFVPIPVTAFAAIMVAVAFISTPTDSSQIETFEETFMPGLTPPPLPLSVFVKDNQVNSLQEASSIIGKSLDKPSYLPQGYDVKMMSASDKGMKLFISKNSVTLETTDQDFVWNQKGITVNITPMSDEKVASQIEQQLKINPDYDPIIIDGKLAAGHEIIRFMVPGQEDVSSAQAQLLYYNNDNKIVVHGLHPLGELAKIAASIP